MAGEVIDYRLCPALRKLLIRFGRAYIIGVARYLNLHVAVLLQKLNQPVELGARLGLEVVLIGIEKQVIQHHAAARAHGLEVNIERRGVERMLVGVVETQAFKQVFVGGRVHGVVVAFVEHHRIVTVLGVGGYELGQHIGVEVVELHFSLQRLFGVGIEYPALGVGAGFTGFHRHGHRKAEQLDGPLTHQAAAAGRLAADAATRTEPALIIGGDEQGSFVFESIQRVAQVARHAPGAGGGLLTPEYVEPAHTNQPVSHIVERGAAGVNKRSHILTRSIHGCAEVFGSAPGSISLQGSHVNVFLPLAAAPG